MAASTCDALLTALVAQRKHSDRLNLLFKDLNEQLDLLNEKMVPFETDHEGFRKHYATVCGGRDIDKDLHGFKM
jgi:hypothetical protein